jgi:hypothetical protein
MLVQFVLEFVYSELELLLCIHVLLYLDLDLHT